jgi:hypothetical protein
VFDAPDVAAIDLSAREAVGFNDPAVWQVGVSHHVADDGSGTLFPSLRAAVEAWNQLPAGRTGVIVLMDSLSDIDTGAVSTSLVAPFESARAGPLRCETSPCPLRRRHGAARHGACRFAECRRLLHQWPAR